MNARVTEERAVEIFESCRNWGRWGPEDERGALNLLTPERVSRAASLARAGRVVSCGRELPVVAGPDNPSPALHHMLAAGDVELMGGSAFSGSMDFVGVAFHGMAVSHLDALCHVFVNGRMYNDRPAGDVLSTGARRNAVTVASDGIVGRGVLIDVPRLRGVEWLEPGAEIMPDELEGACREQGVTTEPGDIILVATGRDARRKEHGPWDPYREGIAGLHPECIPWLHAQDLSVLGCDGISDILPGNPHKWPLPVHMCTLVGMGVHLLDNLHLGRLAEACAAEGRWEFLFCVTPLQIGGGTGSPVNPVAVL